MSTMHCVSCHGTEFDYSDATGSTTCINCGCVAEESNIVSSVEFAETAGGTRYVYLFVHKYSRMRPYSFMTLCS